MITPEEVVRRAERLYIPYLCAWLRGEAFCPVTLPVGRLPADYAELRAAVERLARGAVGAGSSRRGHGYVVAMRAQRTQRHGMQTLPEHVTIESADDLLALIGKRDEFDAFRRDVALARERVPALEPWLARHPQRVIEHHAVWPDLLLVCAYFVDHPRPGCYARELPIPVHTKFVEAHAGILRQLLDAALPAAALDPGAATFERRFGLRADEPLLRLRFLDEALRRRLGLPLDDVSAPLAQLAALDLAGHRCVVAENKLTFLTLPPLRDTVALFGAGFNARALAELPWLAACRVVYWGDLDAQGFQILAALRGALPEVASIMMDEATFAAFRAYAVPGTPCAVCELPHLTPAEQALFARLAGANLRLEQERIDHAYALARLRASS